PAGIEAGTLFFFTVTAQDPFNNTDTNYAGTAHFTTNDPNPTLPADSTLTNGTRTFTAVLRAAGDRTITATDTVATGITGTSGTIVVDPTADPTFEVTAPA